MSVGNSRESTLYPADPITSLSNQRAVYIEPALSVQIHQCSTGFIARRLLSKGAAPHAKILHSCAATRNCLVRLYRAVTNPEN